MNGAYRLHIVLCQPEIPQNTGNIGRTCVALCAKLWLVQPLGFQLDARRLQRAGLDYWKHLNWELVPDWPSLQERLGADRPYWFFSRRGARSLYDVDFGSEEVLVFGSESRGLPASLTEAHPDRTVAIPMVGPVRSLNLANAVAIAAFEAYRQAAAR